MYPKRPAVKTSTLVGQSVWAGADPGGGGGS